MNNRQTSDKFRIGQACWIWKSGDFSIDDHAEFEGEFETIGEEVDVFISADSDYALYLNGELVAFSQFPCYEHSPVGDKLRLKAKKGHNEFLIKVYYCGAAGFSTYSVGKPGLIFSFYENDKEVAFSSLATLSRSDDHFEHGRAKRTTYQLGYRFSYHFECIEPEFKNSVVMDKPKNIRLRENKKTVLKERHPITLISHKNGEYIFDLSEEVVGFLDFDVISPSQKIIIGYAEHLVDNDVIYQIDGRDFSLDFHLKDGENKLLLPFRRLGARYLKLIVEKPLDIIYLGIRPVEYPFAIKKYEIDDPLRKKIYEVSLRTLECCYHDHYEDCPWREQALYALDSRNQMLAGYYCFDNIEAAKSSLHLFLDDRREDGLMPICVPSDLGLFIPSFSLYLFQSFYEYYEHTGDSEMLKDAYPRLKRIVDAFKARLDDGLVATFEGPNAWNFYEWQPGLDGFLKGHSGYVCNEKDLIINCLLIMSLRNIAKICGVIGKKDEYSSLADSIASKLKQERFDKETGLFFMSENDHTYSVLGNSFAILCGLASNKEAAYIAKRLKNNEGLTPITLSMKPFLYDALLQVDPSNKAWVLSDIDEVYKKMLDDGATTFYETEKGWQDFSGAGSLCHGWSAMPIYYYHKLGICK